MKTIDFLSNSPNNYIFQKETYKTNFGGFLSLFFSIIMLIITASYIIDYALNDKYEIEYLKIIDQTDEEEITIMNEDPNLNPTLEFTFSVLSPLTKITQNFLIIYQDNNGDMEFGDPGTYHYSSDLGQVTYDFFLNASVSNLTMFFAYYCGNDPKCTINDEEYHITENSNIYYQLSAPIALIDHSSSNPFLYYKILKAFSYDSTFKQYKRYVYEWNVIKYKEKKGISRIFDNILGLKTEYLAGDINDFGKFESSEFIVNDEEGNYFRILALFRMINNHWMHDEYRRRKITLLDVLSKIGALFVPIKMIFASIYQFYSKNFENYKIIESILNKTKKPYKENKIKTSIELAENILDEPDKDKNTSINNSKISTPLIDSNLDDYRITNAKSKNIDNKNPNVDEEIKENNPERILPKYSFIQFFLNNCYCKCCRRKKYKKQEILRLCNDTIKKYLSVDSILINQIVFENLIKYHKSNNNSLNNIDNNELILNLKELI